MSLACEFRSKAFCTSWVLIDMYSRGEGFKREFLSKDFEPVVCDWNLSSVIKGDFSMVVNHLERFSRTTSNTCAREFMDMVNGPASIEVELVGWNGATLTLERMWCSQEFRGISFNMGL